MEVVDVVALCSVAGSTALLATGPRRRARTAWGPDGRGIRPGAALAVVTAALVLNQLLVVLHVDGAHGGDASYVSRWLGPHWFDLPDWEALHELGRVWPRPDLLAPSVLHVPALLELPFVLLAYLTVAGFFGAHIVRRLARRPLLWAASASFTVTFCLIEWELRNPWTTGDLVLRIASGVVTPWCIGRLLAVRGAAPRPSARGLALALVSTATLGGLVLVLYDTVLLYSLGRLPDRLATVVGLAVVLATTRALAVRPEKAGSIADEGSAIAWLTRAAAGGLVAFFVPSLALRYEVTFGSRGLAVLGSAVVLATVVALSRPTAAAVARALPGVLAATAAAFAVLHAGSRGAPYYEVTLLVVGASSVAVLVVACAAVDRLVRG